MDELLRPYVGTVVALFVMSAMFSLGLDLTVRQIAEPLRNRRLMAFALGSNFVAVPLIVLALATAIPLDEPVRVGLIVYALCTGSEGAPKFVQIARGNAAFAVGLLVVLLAWTVIGIPWILGAVVPEVPVERAKLLLKLLVVIGMPLSLGLLIRARRAAFAGRLAPLAHRVAMLFLVGGVTLIVFVNFREFASLGLRAMLAGLLLFVLSFATGYFAGGSRVEDRRSLAIMTMVRGGGVAMMIAGQVFPHDPKVIVTITAMTTLSILIIVPLSVVLRRSAPGTGAAAEAAPAP